MDLKAVKLGDKFDLEKDSILISGTQALVRLTLMQRKRDEFAGLNTAGLVTGYRGSPVGGVDQQFVRAGKIIAKNNVTFQPGLNEDLAATALWGCQQAEMRGEGKYDGVFGLWYGKGPGVDRTGDVFRHANAAGSSKYGGVLVLMGDDHTAESSTVAHQSEFALMDALIPILNPAGVQEILDYGLLGIELARFSGCWVGLKCLHDNIESTAVVDGSLNRIKVQTPKDFKIPEGGLNIRAWDDRHEQERRLHIHKRFAATSFARANKIDRIVLEGGKRPKIGIVTTGKSYLDTREALDSLGIDEVAAANIGLRLLKIGLVWPLDPEIIEKFCQGLELIVVIEEKRSLLETQIREQLYGRKNAPVIIGKKDENGVTLFQAHGALDPNQIAIALGERILGQRKNESVAKKLSQVKSAMRNTRNTPEITTRIPYFCAGCPHNTSTVVPEGGRGYAGIGCHWMAHFVEDRRTEGSTQMGGEGANWIGEAPFSTRKHVFQNLGDGTYNHSGVLALRAALAAGVTMTYKILYNDAVAMTGGQPHEGSLTVPMIARQVVAEGVERLMIVSDEPDKYPSNANFPSFTTVHHRSELDTLQKELMETDGVSVLIYDQTCAAEKRRRRKRGLYPDPDRRVFINELVCEGCGDCGVKSNCVAIAPLETEFGRKRKIDQSACNKDFSCLNGFCPSFVTVEGGKLRKGKGLVAQSELSPVFETLPDPDLPDLNRPWGMMITGIGGTGVVTVGQILGMAAHLEGKGAGMIDMAGLSQKNGAVVTHMKIAARPEDIQTIRATTGSTDVLIGCDLVTSAAENILSTLGKKRSSAVVNSHETMPAQFTHHRDFQLHGDDLKVGIEARVKRGGAMFVDATQIATALLGDAIASNLFLLGATYQAGLIPMSAQAIEKAIELNGVAVEMNRRAFLWGRRSVHNLDAVLKIAEPQKSEAGFAKSLEEIVALRANFLTAYQNAKYSARYTQTIETIRIAEEKQLPGESLLAETAARSLFRLMAYKDEYEVARLFCDGNFESQVATVFEGDYKLHFHMAPPVFAKRNPSGELEKKAFGPWIMGAFKILTFLNGFRGTAFDPFGFTNERKTERRLIVEFEQILRDIAENLTPEHHSLAVEMAALPQKIRGFGHVKLDTISVFRSEMKNLREQFQIGSDRVARAAE